MSGEKVDEGLADWYKSTAQSLDNINGNFLHQKTRSMVKAHLDKVYPVKRGTGRSDEDANKYFQHAKSFNKTYDNGGMLGVAMRIHKEKKEYGLKEDVIRRAHDHEHSMAKRYLGTMEDGDHLSIGKIGVHDKSGRIHIHYAAKGMPGGGRYVVLDKNGKEVKLKKR
jgi:hypothetical protein